MELVFRLVFKTNSRRIKPAVAGSIPALSAQLKHTQRIEKSRSTCPKSTARSQKFAGNGYLAQLA